MMLYEVAYAVHPNGSIECSATDTTTFTELYISYLNTTDSSVNVTGLQSSTCYIFGIRLYTVGVGVAGEWTVLTSTTLSLGIKSQLSYYYDYFNPYSIDQCPLNDTAAQSSSSSSTDLPVVVGTVTFSVIIVTLIVLLVVQFLVIVYMKK